MEKVLTAEEECWKNEYASRVPAFLKEVPLFLGEDCTAWMREHGLGEPHHENAWGAMFNALIARSGQVIRTGKTRLATSKKTHAHSYRLWKSLLCVESGRLQTLGTELNNIKTAFHTKKITLMQALTQAAEAGASSSDWE